MEPKIGLLNNTMPRFMNKCYAALREEPCEATHGHTRCQLAKGHTGEHVGPAHNGFVDMPRIRWAN